MRLRRVQCSLLATGVCLCAAVVPPAVQAQAPKSISFARQVTVKRGVLAKGRSVMVHGAVSHPVARAARWWGMGTVAGVVRAGIDRRYRGPFTSHGYRCTPRITGDMSRYLCTRREAGLSTVVRLRFAVDYSQPSLGSAGPGSEHTLEIDVTGLPAGRLADVIFDNAVLSPYSSTTPGVPTYFASGASSLVLPRNAVVITAGSTSNINATVKVIVAVSDPNTTDLTGHADIPDGAKVSVNVDSRGAQGVSAGNFSVPLK